MRRERGRAVRRRRRATATGRSACVRTCVNAHSPDKARVS